MRTSTTNLAGSRRVGCGESRSLSLASYFTAGGINIGLTVANSEFFRHFADNSTLAWVRAAWRDIFMSNPQFWGGALAAGELALAFLLVVGGRWARFGYVGVIAFHIGLLFFGLAYWLWSIPVLAMLVPIAFAYWHHTASTAPADNQR